MLQGPEKIEISNEQLEQLNSVYKELAEDVSNMLNDFFSPFELMRSEEVFTGKSADTYTEFCLLCRHYLEVRFSMSFDELEKAAADFREKINEVESYTG